nr:retrovirus-related Pol polyprotein from transposon TNT 1-94 [Tanacetum cinerariifolium]
RDVVFMEDKIQENKEGDSTTRETTSIHMEKEFQSNDSFEVALQHEVNETNESQAPATRTLNRERRRLGWLSDYVMESNVAYYLLTEDGEPSTLQEALNNLDASFLKEAMKEETEALHKNKTWELVPLPGGGGWGGCWSRVGEAREGRWLSGSDRSEGEEAFWFRRKKPAGKVFRRRRRGGRLAVVAGGGGVGE